MTGGTLLFTRKIKIDELFTTASWKSKFTRRKKDLSDAEIQISIRSDGMSHFELSTQGTTEVILSGRINRIDADEDPHHPFRLFIRYDDNKTLTLVIKDEVGKIRSAAKTVNDFRREYNAVVSDPVHIAKRLYSDPRKQQPESLTQYKKAEDLELIDLDIKRLNNSDDLRYCEFVGKKYTEYLFLGARSGETRIVTQRRILEEYGGMAADEAAKFDSLRPETIREYVTSGIHQNPTPPEKQQVKTYTTVGNSEGDILDLLPEMIREYLAFDISQSEQRVSREEIRTIEETITEIKEKQAMNDVEIENEKGFQQSMEQSFGQPHFSGDSSQAIETIQQDREVYMKRLNKKKAELQEALSNAETELGKLQEALSNAKTEVDRVTQPLEEEVPEGFKEMYQQCLKEVTDDNDKISADKRMDSHQIAIVAREKLSYRRRFVAIGTQLTKNVLCLYINDPRVQDKQKKPIHRSESDYQVYKQGFHSLALRMFALAYTEIEDPTIVTDKYIKEKLYQTISGFGDNYAMYTDTYTNICAHYIIQIIGVMDDLDISAVTLSVTKIFGFDIPTQVILELIRFCRTEKLPKEEKTVGSDKIMVYSKGQQRILGVDEEGRKSILTIIEYIGQHMAKYYESHPDALREMLTHEDYEEAFGINVRGGLGVYDKNRVVTLTDELRRLLYRRH